MSVTSVQAHLFYEGRVQGVGFRWTAQRLAAGFALTGFVRNLQNGRVELVVEGEREQVERYLAALAARMGAYLTGSEILWGDGTGAFRGFEIRH